MDIYLAGEVIDWTNSGVKSLMKLLRFVEGRWGLIAAGTELGPQEYWRVCGGAVLCIVVSFLKGV